MFLNFDICDKNLYKELDKFQFDAVYHLAAQSAGETSYDDPKYDILTNSYGTCMLAKYCLEKKIKRFIYTSTVAVYGTSKKEGFFENDSKNPDSIYGVSKYSGELFVKQFFKNSSINYTIFRVFNTYGPGENLNFSKKGMLSIYASYIWKKEPIEVKGSLDRYRDFLFVEDNVEILYKSLNLKGSHNKIYNLSSGEKIVIRDLIKVMIKVSGEDSSYPVKELPPTEGDSFGTHGNIDKLKEDFNWSPRFSIEEGLQKYFLWINKIPYVENLEGYHPFEMNSFQS